MLEEFRFRQPSPPGVLMTFSGPLISSHRKPSTGTWQLRALQTEVLPHPPPPGSTLAHFKKSTRPTSTPLRHILSHSGGCFYKFPSVRVEDHILLDSKRFLFGAPPIIFRQRGVSGLWGIVLWSKFPSHNLHGLNSRLAHVPRWSTRPAPPSDTVSLPPSRDP